MRGLKPIVGGGYTVNGEVAPRAGAWIETEAERKEYDEEIVSHPVRVRGLKLVVS